MPVVNIYNPIVLVILGSKQCLLIHNNTPEEQDKVINDIIRKITSKVKEDIAREMSPLLTALIPKVCHGCMFDSPGQLDHDMCLSDDEVSCFHKLFAEAWRRIDLKSLVRETMLVGIVNNEEITQSTQEPIL